MASLGESSMVRARFSSPGLLIPYAKAILKNVDESQQSSFRDAAIELRVERENGNAISLCEIIADRAHRLPRYKEEGTDKDGFLWAVPPSANDDDVIRAYVVKFPDGTIVTHPTTGHQGNISELRFDVRETITSFATRLGLPSASS